MQRRPSMVYIRRRSCSRRTVRCGLAFMLLLIFMLCLNMRLIWSLVWAGIFTVLFRMLVIGKYL